MKNNIILAIVVLSLASCANMQIKPVKLTYTDVNTGITLTENVGDGVLGLEVDLTKPIDLGGGRTLDIVLVEPSK